MAEIRSELREGILQLLLVHQLHALGVERGEAGGIGDERIASQAVKLNVARGMATAAELFRNLADGQLKLRAGAVQKAGFADAGISGQAGELSCKRFAQGLDALACFRARDEHGDARSAVDLRKGLRRSQIVLVDDDEGRDVLQLGDGEDAVDEKRFRHRDGAGGQHDKLVDIGDRRADKRVFPRQKRLQNTLVPLPGDTDEIADEGRLVLPPEAASGAALDNAVLRLYIIEAAQGFDDAILFHALTQTGSAANRRSRRRGRRRPGAYPCP